VDDCLDNLKGNIRTWYQKKFGPLPDHINVLHKCDNPNCRNEDHIFLGTQLDNMRDMKSKNRGPKNRGNVLTPELVREIRASNKSIYKLAQEIGVSVMAVWKAKNRHTWNDVT
jgi:hypothetical protein